MLVRKQNSQNCLLQIRFLELIPKFLFAVVKLKNEGLL